LEKKQVRIFDVGIVEPGQRSKMYQVLKIFGLPHISFSIFCNLVNELLNQPEHFQKMPRITIDNRLVIQRKSQIISKEYLPQQIEYEKIILWKNKYFDTDLLYLKTLNQKISKPQLIDFKSPLSVLVFNKILNSKPNAIRFTEMLPSEKDLIKMDDEKFCSEFVFQWKKEK